MRTPRLRITDPIIVGQRQVSRNCTGHVDLSTMPAKAHKTRTPSKAEIKRAEKRASRHRNRTQ